jgi:hypothetical protein
MKSTLKREFKEREIAERETFGTIVAGSVLRHMPAGQRQFVLGNGGRPKGAKQLALQLGGIVAGDRLRNAALVFNVVPMHSSGAATRRA